MKTREGKDKKKLFEILKKAKYNWSPEATTLQCLDNKLSDYALDNITEYLIDEGVIVGPSNLYDRYEELKRTLKARDEHIKWLEKELSRLRKCINTKTKSEHEIKQRTLKRLIGELKSRYSRPWRTYIQVSSKDLDSFLKENW